MIKRDRYFWRKKKKWKRNSRIGSCCLNKGVQEKPHWEWNIWKYSLFKKKWLVYLKNRITETEQEWERESKRESYIAACLCKNHNVRSCPRSKTGPSNFISVSQGPCCFPGYVSRNSFEVEQLSLELVLVLGCYTKTPDPKHVLSGLGGLHEYLKQEGAWRGRGEGKNPNWEHIR